MDELSNKDKEDAEYSEERKTLFKTLIKMHFQKNFIWYTLTNIMTNWKEKQWSTEKWCEY